MRQALSEQAGFDPLDAIRAGRSFKDIEVSIDIPGGRGPLWFSCSGTPTSEIDASARSYFGRSGSRESHLLLLANDITARRRAEEQMVHGMREALGAAVYQMQGPLNVIQAAIGMLKRSNPEPTTLASMLAQISASSQQAMATLKESPAPSMGMYALISRCLAMP